MKFNKWTIGLAGIAVAGIMACNSLARAQDFFSGTRTYVAVVPQTLSSATGIVTNGPVDHLKFEGRVIMNFITVTNTGASGGTLTATVYTSPDTTNFTALANYALISAPTSEPVTNYWTYGGSNVVNNLVMLPGTVTYPSVASGGFATPYLAPLQYTNSAAITLNGNKNVAIGFNIDTQARYIYVVYTPGGTVTNFSTGALISGFTKF